MNRPPKALVVLLSSLSLGSCLSFRIKAPLPSEDRLEIIEVCKDVTEAGESLAPSEPGVDFTEKDARVCCFIQVQSGAEAVQLRWKWYSPDKKLWKDTGAVAVARKTGELASITAYDFIRPGDRNLPRGEWTVAVFVNEILAGRMKFRIGKELAFMELSLCKGRVKRPDVENVAESRFRRRVLSGVVELE